MGENKNKSVSIHSMRNELWRTEWESDGNFTSCAASSSFFFFFWVDAYQLWLGLCYTHTPLNDNTLGNFGEQNCYLFIPKVVGTDGINRQLWPGKTHGKLLYTRHRRGMAMATIMDFWLLGRSRVCQRILTGKTGRKTTRKKLGSSWRRTCCRCNFDFQQAMPKFRDSIGRNLYSLELYGSTGCGHSMERISSDTVTKLLAVSNFASISLGDFNYFRNGSEHSDDVIP